ncbi:TerB family tellurite resistance protein [Pontibacter silvestris]|uniref:TerB family tellurite resistance protein n=1 Tax=Pontibacter silvestris TaxID=2305183 RepID=A0ABW4X0R5_9BACT|nr:TerB family tellurite resistance protein [Pontibacter silvestris]MCC9137515.1 TerB family tellurite resistance protein [Pontibacter silvestris]
MHLIIKRTWYLLPLFFLATLFLGPNRARAQSEEAQQLLLNVEKLAQLKSILSDMKTGYDIIHKGYGAVKAISEGSFSLHDAFLSSLLEVSPTVRKYKRVADIIEYQRRIVSEHTRAYARFRQGGSFTLEELAYLGSVYASLNRQSLRHLDELTLILTAGELRMSEEERLAAIDRIFTETEDKLTFLRHFNRQAGLLALQRDRERFELESIQGLYRINP